jgi:hypothetical protein
MQSGMEKWKMLHPAQDPAPNRTGYFCMTFMAVHPQKADTDHSASRSSSLCNCAPYILYFFWCGGSVVEHVKNISNLIVTPVSFLLSHASMQLAFQCHPTWGKSQCDDSMTWPQIEQGTSAWHFTRIHPQKADADYSASRSFLAQNSPW